MEFSYSSQFDIVYIYRRFCDIKSGNVDLGNVLLNDDSEKVKFLREATFQLSKMVHSSVNMSLSILDELHKLMSYLNIKGDFTEFSNFYDFVFFMCREKGQKNITVSRAIAAWKLVLSGRFRLLNQWCAFVEKNQQYNISEDTWRQVLSFSRCVHEDLEGYDPEGAWPTLIDDFVEHMYRITGSNHWNSRDLTCNCNDPEGESSMFEEPLPGLKNLPGLKRKFRQDLQGSSLENNFCSDMIDSKSEMIDSKSEIINFISCKRRRQKQQHNLVRCGEVPQPHASDEGLHAARNSLNCTCAVEGCLLKGFSSLFSSHSVQNQEQRVSYT